MKTITSKYPGTCRRCGNRFEAGSKIRYGGRGLTYHVSADCTAAQIMKDRREYLDRQSEPKADPIDTGYEDACAVATRTDREK